jgi:hypothetical protein
MNTKWLSSLSQRDFGTYSTLTLGDQTPHVYLLIHTQHRVMTSAISRLATLQHPSSPKPFGSFFNSRDTASIPKQKTKPVPRRPQANGN